MSSEIKIKDQLLQQTWVGFNANVGSLLIFSREIASIADRLDRERVHHLAMEFAALFGDDPTDVEKELLELVPSLDNLEIYPDFRQNYDFKEALSFVQTGDFRMRAFNWAIENPSQAHKLVNIINTEFSEPSNSGIILRRSTLIHLIGFFELFLQNILFAYYYSHPDSHSVQTDEVSRRKWAIRKAESKMRGGWKTKIDNVLSLGSCLYSTEEYLNELFEIVQRRNLMVHNDGVIDEDFLSRIPEKYKVEKDWKPGQVLVISSEYLQRALDIIQLIGFALHQTAWRKWQATSPKKANEAFGNFVFAALKQERYQLVCNLADLSTSLSLPQKHMHIMKVNQAIAFRESGQTDKVQKIISELGHVNSSLSVQIAISVLRCDYKKTQLLLLKAARKNQLWRISQDWPLFKPIKDETWFKTMFIHTDKGRLLGKAIGKR